MYEAYWKLNSRPFDQAFAKESYYPSDSHQAALLKLRYSIEHRRAAALVTGISGVGKSMVLSRLAEQSIESVGPWITLNYTCLSASEMLKYLAQSVSPTDASGITGSADALRVLEHFLIKNCEAKQHAVVVVDEAHLLQPTEHLETLRQLMNLAARHSTGESAWTFVLSGMPSVVSNVQRNGAFADRISVQCVIPQFTQHDTSAYVAHRLRAAGSERPSIFQSDAIDLIHNVSQGIPRKINTLCDLALMVGYAQERENIQASLIESIYAEMNPDGYIGELATNA